MARGLKRQHEAWQQAVESLLKELDGKLVEAAVDEPAAARGLQAPEAIVEPKGEELRVRSSRLELARKTVQDSSGGARLPKLLEEVLQDRSEEEVALTEPRPKGLVKMGVFECRSRVFDYSGFRIKE